MRQEDKTIYIIVLAVVLILAFSYGLNLLQRSIVGEFDRQPGESEEEMMERLFKKGMTDGCVFKGGEKQRAYCECMTDSIFEDKSIEELKEFTEAISLAEPGVAEELYYGDEDVMVAILTCAHLIEE